MIEKAQSKQPKLYMNKKNNNNILEWHILSMP
jgi:hypothetical protein